MVSKKAVKPKVPKGYTDEYTTYELITKTTYSKPWKEPKRRKGAKATTPKEYVQAVKIVSDSSGRKKKKSSTSHKSKRY